MDNTQPINQQNQEPPKPQSPAPFPPAGMPSQQKTVPPATSEARPEGRPIPPTPPSMSFSRPAAVPPVPPSRPADLGEARPFGRPTPPPPPPPIPPRPPMPPVAPAAPSIPSAPATPKTPPPPTPEINVRTLGSDVKSLEESGGLAAKPQSIKLENLEDNAPIFRPETVNQLPEAGIKPTNKTLKIIAMLLGGMAAAVAVGAVGYYFIYPLLFPPQVPVETAEPGTTAPTPIATVPGTTAPALAGHASLFQNLPQLKADITLSDLNAIDIITALQNEAANTAAPQTVKEIVITLPTGQAAFPAYLSTLVSDINPADMNSIVEDDFTAFLFYDTKGVWPGYVAKVKPGVPAANAQATLAKLESTDLSRLYVAAPGTPGTFNSGSYKGIPTRYSAFFRPGASFNYAVTGDYAILSTSFEGLKMAVSLLGL